MNYKPEQFSKCSFNPLADNLLNAYPVLAGVFGDNVRLLRYAICVYDPFSPLIQDYPDWSKRKEAAAALAGYDLETEWDYLEEVFNGKDEQALLLIHKFLRTCIRSRVWAMIVSSEETFWEYNQRLKVPIAKSDRGDKDNMAATALKTKLAEDQEEFHKRIVRLQKEFFGGDEEVALAAEGLDIKTYNPETIGKHFNKER